MNSGFSRAAAIAVLSTLSCAAPANEVSSAPADVTGRGARAGQAAGPLLAVGAYHSCVVGRRGLRCWGLPAAVQGTPALRNPSQLSAGNNHTCAFDDGVVKCWGANTYGQTGVPSSLRGPRQISAGGLHTCAVDESGVTCWGNDANKQVSAPPLRRPVQVTAGNSHSCALDDDGIKCWGTSPAGQATVPPLRHPREVLAGSGYSCALDDDGVKCWGSAGPQAQVPVDLRRPKQIVPGVQHTCALDDDGVKCWGGNAYGESALPTLHHPTQVDVGAYHTCVVDDDGVKCWGNDQQRQSSVPEDVDIVGRHLCVPASGGLRCVGDNERGQLGIGNDLDRVDAIASASRTDLGAGFIASSLALGRGFGCARSAHPSGAVKCWGSNGRGQLGLGDTRDRGAASGDMGDALPALRFGSGALVTKVAVGLEHACALGGGGEVFCWGEGGSGQLGTETAGVATVPARVALDPSFAVRDIVLGNRHTCVLGADGRVACFGDNAGGQLGLGHATPVGDRPGSMGTALRAVDLGPDFRASALASGANFACALSTDGRVKCWGENERGELGLGDTRNRGTSPGDLGSALPTVSLGQGQAITSLVCGAHHCCVTTVQNTLKCWGDNSEGQLGLGDRRARGATAGSMGDDLPFVQMPSRERVLGLELAGDRTCARTESGLRCWGRNRSGELGYGDRAPRGATLDTIPRTLPPLGL